QKPRRRPDTRARALISHDYCNVQFNNARRPRMINGTTAPPGYVLPSRPRWQGGWNVRAVLGAVVAFVLTASAATQWLAAQLNNPVEMGDPIVWFQGAAVFQPFAGLVLWKHFAGSRLISSSVRKEIWIAF